MLVRLAVSGDGHNSDDSITVMATFGDKIKKHPKLNAAMAGKSRLAEPALRKRFLRVLAHPRVAGSVPTACGVVGITVRCYERYRSKDREFAEAATTIIREAPRDRQVMLEASAYQRALYGIAVPVYRKDWEWLDEDPDNKPQVSDGPLKALKKARQTKNIIGWKQVPPSDSMLQFLLKSLDRNKYDRPAQNINVTAMDPQKTILEEMRILCEKKGVPFSEKAAIDSLLRRFDQGQYHPVDAESTEVS